MDAIQLTADLVQGASDQVDFLKEINSIRDQLVNEQVLAKALYRYEKLWMPFQCQNGGDKLMTPPLDVEFVWHCHMLCPHEYRTDCLALWGRVVDHTILSAKERKLRNKPNRNKWECQFKVAYDFTEPNSINEQDFLAFKSNIKYDIYAACQRQINFFYQVSLPHYKAKSFLRAALKRYTKFLYLIKLNSGSFMIPCFAIDLIWHTHQLNPLSYFYDTTKVLGRMLSHDDSINDRTAGSKLDTSFRNTCELWRKQYGEVYFFPGGMFRGIPLEFGNRVGLSPQPKITFGISFDERLIDVNQRDIELTDHDGNCFKMRAVYCEHLRTWTRFDLFQDGQLISNASLIHSNQLADSKLVKNKFYNLNSRFERAMLISNPEGDHALVKSRLSSNSLSVSYYSLEHQKLMCQFQVRSTQLSLKFRVNKIKVNVDLKAGRVAIDANSLSVADNRDRIICSALCFVFSVIALYVPISSSESEEFLMVKYFRKHENLIEFEAKQRKLVCI